MSLKVFLAAVLTLLAFNISAFSAEETTVYFFHTNKRCTKCRNLQAYAKEAVDQLADKTIHWKVVNIENAGNEHYVSEYSLITSSVVLVREVDGQVEKWKNLDKIWLLVKNKQKYIDYIQENIKSF